MSIITKIFGGGAKALIGSIGGVLDNLTTSKEEKMEAKAKLVGLIAQRDAEIEETLRTTLQAKERVIVAELQQGDNYTKRARPTVVYAGLVMIFLNYCIIPAIGLYTGKIIPPFELPVEFWTAWGGIVITWCIGRSAEKRGAANNVLRAITGTKKFSLLDE